MQSVGGFRYLSLGSVSLRRSERLDSLRSPPKSSMHIMAITGSFRDHKVKATTLLAHQKIGGRHQ